MPITNEPRRFLEIDDAHFLRDAVSATCEALKVEGREKEARAAIAGRVADLARSGLKTVDAIRDRIVREARALADIRRVTGTREGLRSYLRKFRRRGCTG